MDTIKNEYNMTGMWWVYLGIAVVVIAIYMKLRKK